MAEKGITRFHNNKIKAFPGSFLIEIPTPLHENLLNNIFHGISDPRILSSKQFTIFQHSGKLPSFFLT